MSFAFKEWKVVCDALGSGQQHVLLRKGGIAEGKKGFAFEHSEFLLFPTLFHAQAEKIRFPMNVSLDSASQDIKIGFFAKVTWSQILTDWKTVQKLEPFHIWTQETIRERFEQKPKPCIHLAVVRVFQILPPWFLTHSPEYGGCKSWIELPEIPPHFQLHPVITDKEHEGVMKQIKEICAD